MLKTFGVSLIDGDVLGGTGTYEEFYDLAIADIEKRTGGQRH